MLEVVMSFVGIGVIVWTLMFIWGLATGKSVELDIQADTPLKALLFLVLGWPAALFALTQKLFGGERCRG